MRRLKLARLLLTLLTLFPKRHSLRSSESKLTEPFFIFGSGRNGSTLLNVILNQHPNIFIPPEQYFLGNSIVKYQLYNYLPWRDLVKIVYGEVLSQTDGHMWQFSSDKIMSDAFNFSKGKKNLQSMLHHIYSSYATTTKPDSIIWGDSTPLNTRSLPEIFSCFPKAKFIFLVRDGRDVVASYKKGTTQAFDDLADTLIATDVWLDSITKYHWLKKRTSVLEVKYESLVSQPEDELVKIIEFIGEKYHSGMLQFYKNVPGVDAYNEAQHQKIHEPIQTNSIGKWKEILSEDERVYIEKKMRHFLREFNYL